MSKIAIGIFIGLSLSVLIALIFLRPLKVEPPILSPQTISSNDGATIKPEGAPSDRDLLLSIKAQISSLEARLQALENRAGLPQTQIDLPPFISAPLPTKLPDGRETPWAWIEKLDAGKKSAVEKAFEEAAAAVRLRMPPPGVAPDDSTLGAAKENLDQDLANRLRSILSPQEFEAYLSSLPSALRTRIEERKYENR